MQTLAPDFTITVDPVRDEVHFAASGLRDMAKMIDFQRELLEKAKPLIERNARIHGLGDFRGLVTQTQEVADAMRIVIRESAKLGVVKTAIISDNLLAKMQFKRLNDEVQSGVVEIFEDKNSALSWLRQA